MSTWRQRAAPIIHDVIARVGREDEKALRRELRKAYPFMERMGFCYKVWLDEIRCQLGKRQFGRRPKQPAAGQLELFAQSDYRSGS